MKLSEKELEDIVFQTPNELLREKGLPIYGRKIRQLKIGNYGIADIVTFEREIERLYGQYKSVLNINVIELKQDVININTFLQATKYVKGIVKYLRFRDFYDFRISMTLIGTSVDMSNFVYLPDIIEFKNDYEDISSGNLNLIKAEYDINGINFKEHIGYSLIDGGFSNKLI